MECTQPARVLSPKESTLLLPLPRHQQDTYSPRAPFPIPLSTPRFRRTPHSYLDRRNPPLDRILNLLQLLPLFTHALDEFFQRLGIDPLLLPAFESLTFPSQEIVRLEVIGVECLKVYPIQIVALP